MVYSLIQILLEILLCAIVLRTGNRANTQQLKHYVQKAKGCYKMKSDTVGSITHKTEAQETA